MIGKTISHYKITGKLGEGGMGTVYKATDTRLERVVALKFLSGKFSATPEQKKRLSREARAIAALNHPNICTIFDIGEDNGIQFIVMEYVEGDTLRKKLKKINLKTDTVLDLALQITSALREAHSRGVIHRDIKSDNIMITPDDRVKVMDFGLAKLKGSEILTKTGKTVGTVTSMSPEQVRGEEVDARTDIWSLGVVMYEMFTGQMPFSGEYEHAVMYSILNEDPVPVSGPILSASPETDEVVKRCLAKDKDARYQSASELADDISGIRELLNAKKHGGSNDTHPESGKKLLYNRLSGVAGLLLLILAVIIFALYTSGWGPFQNISDSPAETESIRLTVLPFTNIGNDPNRQVFCDGLVETITSNLTKVERDNKNIWVVPAGEVRGNNISSPGEAHRTFGVNYAVTGSLQPLSDRLRLTVHLVDSKNLRQVNSAVIDVDASDVISLHDKSVENLLAMLNLELEPGTRAVMKAGYTTISAAFEPYIQGLGYLQRYEKIENINAAIEAFRQSVNADPRFAMGYAGLGQAFWRKYDYTREPEWLDKAIEYAEIAQDLDGDLSQVNITLGMINRGTGLYEKAIGNFYNVLKADSTNADAYRELARTYESVGDIEKAESTIRRSIDLKPGYWSGHNSLGALYLRHNRYKKAIGPFEKVIELTPDNYIGYMNLASTYYLLERYTDARQMYEQSLALETTYDASSNLGRVYFIEGQFDKAARMFESALEINDGNYMVWGNLGSAYYWTPGEREKARPAYMRAIELAEQQKEINPNDPYVVSALASYRLMTGDSETARKYADQALEMAPGNTWVMFSAGTTFERLGNRDLALHWIGKAIENGYSVSEIVNQPDLQNLIADKNFQAYIEN